MIVHDHAETPSAITLKPASTIAEIRSNCAIGALVDARARVVWRCMPRFDGDPVFHALIDSQRGVGPDGTLAVESDDTAPATGELWGNFPQTYSMVGIVNGAVRLSRPWDQVV